MWLRIWGVGLVALFAWTAAATTTGSIAAQDATPPKAANRPPNFVIIVADDLGYGDLACYGNSTMRTPRLDAMARDGMRFTHYYAPAAKCTPSRAGLLTGRLAIRSGMTQTLAAAMTTGLPPEEITLAEALAERGYRSACIGKWHLGSTPRTLPQRHGFDVFFGLPYSNDYNRSPKAPKGIASLDKPRDDYWNVPLIDGTETIEQPADQSTLTRRFTDRAVEFIRENRERPFLLYVAHTAPHVPLFPARDFAGKSARGRYGDVVEEIDHSTGRIVDALRAAGLASNTLVVFTSDNGPWLDMAQHGGSAGPFRGGKNTILEGGMRVPMIACWPGRIPGDRINRELASGLDIFPTCIALAGAEMPAGRLSDGFDLSPALTGEGPSKRTEIFYYKGERLDAIRVHGNKAHLVANVKLSGVHRRVELDPPAVFDVLADPGERRDISRKKPGLRAWFFHAKQRHLASIEEGRRRWAARFRGETVDEERGENSGATGKKGE